MVEGKGMNIDDLLKDKEATHGSFDDTATIAQTLKAVMRRGKNWEHLPPASKEALELIATKAARILNGDATDPEHWLDISGYAKLRANAFAPHRGLEAGIATIAQRLRPVTVAPRVNDESGAAS
jgi:hypothetical protein